MGGRIGLKDNLTVNSAFGWLTMCHSPPGLRHRCFVVHLESGAWVPGQSGLQPIDTWEEFIGVVAIVCTNFIEMVSGFWKQVATRNGPWFQVRDPLQHPTLLAGMLGDVWCRPMPMCGSEPGLEAGWTENHLAAWKSKVAEQKTMLVCLKLEMPKQQWRFKRSIFGIQLRCYWPSRLTPGAASWPGLIKSRFPGWLTGKTNGYTYGQPLNHSTITTLVAICCYNYKVLSEFRRKPS